MPYDPDFLADIDRVLTRGRLSRYLTAAGGDIELALQLYEKNLALSEALFGFLHGVEIATRNSIHFVLSRDIGRVDWYRRDTPLPALFPTAQRLAFTGPMLRMIDDARGKAGPAAPIGKVIAELTFGFWPNILTKNFGGPLWDASLSQAFPHVTKPLRVVHWRLQTIQRLRNRIAHHEPILTSTNEVYTGSNAQPKIALSAVLEFVSWISPPTADWLQATTRYNQGIALLTEVASSGVVL